MRRGGQGWLGLMMVGNGWGLGVVCGYTWWSENWLTSGGVEGIHCKGEPGTVMRRQRTVGFF